MDHGSFADLHEKFPIVYARKEYHKSSGSVCLQYISTILAVGFLADCYDLMIIVLAACG